MAPETHDSPPLFWTESWRWAAPAWHSLYGAPARAFDCHEARLVYSAWVPSFGLSREWRPPADPRWLSLVQAPPAVLQGVAAVLGYIALLRAGMPSALLCGAPMNRWFAQALKYRQVNCMHSTGVARVDHPFDACEHGVQVLRLMARQDWPLVESRVAMLVAPKSSDDRNRGRFPAETSVFGIERVDVGRCLSIGGAVVRHAAAESLSRGEQ